MIGGADKKGADKKGEKKEKEKKPAEDEEEGGGDMGFSLFD